MKRVQPRLRGTGAGPTCDKDAASGNKEEEFVVVGGAVAGADRQTVVLLGQTFVWPTIDWGTSGKSAQLRPHCMQLIIVLPL